MAQSASEITGAKTRRGMTEMTVALAAGIPKRLNVSGDYFHVLVAPSGDLQVSFDNNKRQRAFAAVGFRVYYDVVELYSAGGQTVSVLVGFGSVADGRRQSDSDFPPSNDTPATPAVLCAAGAQTLLIAADGSRQEVRVSVPSDAAGPVYIADVDVDAVTQGALFEPGVTDYMATSGALYVWNPNASDVTVYALPLRRV